MAAFGRCTEIPNLHRFRELLESVVPRMLHLRHVQELLFEKAQQTLKSDIVTGNGHDDAMRAMKRMLHGQLASQIAPQPAYFGIEPEWLHHAGVCAHLCASQPLWRQPSGTWRCSGGTLIASRVTAVARELAQTRWQSTCQAKWRGRATIGDDARLKVDDCVGVLVLMAPPHTTVNIARGSYASELSCITAYCRTVAVFDNSSGSPAAIVQQFFPVEGSLDVMVDGARFRYLPLYDGVCRALRLHSCCCACSNQPSGCGHSTMNCWRVLKRQDGYPSGSE